jgi:hypothetical protein
MLLKNKNNRYILIESFLIFSFAVVAFILCQNRYLFFIGIFDIVFLWFIIARRLFVEKRTTIIEIFLVFFSFYISGAYLLFNTSLLSLTEDAFLIKISVPTIYELRILNIFFLVHTKIQFIVLLDVKEKAQKFVSIDNYGQFNKIYYIPIIIYSVFLLFIKIRYGNYFTFIKDSPDIMYSLISYGGIICSPIIISSNIKCPWYKKRLFIIITIVPIILLALIGIRIYSLLFIFSLILNMQVRGLKLYHKSILFLIVILLGFVLFQAVARSGLSEFGNLFSILTLLGEFYIPGISSYYLIIDPEKFYPHINIVDFFVSLLPAKLIPYISLNEFASYYYKRGISTWPIGGIFLYGQLHFYFGIFSFIAMILFSFYLLRIRRKLDSKRLDLSVIGLPLLFIVLPRYPLYLIKSVLVGLILFLFFKFLLVKKITLEK